MPEPSATGRNAKAFRERLGWSQNEAARRAGVSQAFVSRLEAGEHQEAGGRVLQALARALGVTVDDLLREEPRQDGPGRTDAGLGDSQDPVHG